MPLPFYFASVPFIIRLIAFALDLLQLLVQLLPSSWVNQLPSVEQPSSSVMQRIASCTYCSFIIAFVVIVEASITVTYMLH